MSAVTHRSPASGGYMARIASIAPGARIIKSLQAVRSKRHTIVEARQAVAAKLRLNQQYLDDPENNERPDLVYREQPDGSYGVGVKYGNRWLTGLFDGETYISVPGADQASELLKVLADDAEGGVFDNYIKPVMDANGRAARKR